MKVVISIVFLINAFYASSQIPANYYYKTIGLSGEDLKLELNNIINGHISYPYTSDSTDVWDILKESDRDPNNENNVILVYTGVSVNVNQEWNRGKGWNREHVWSVSHGGFDSSDVPGRDVHHIKPCDPSANSAKSNKWFDYSCDKYFNDNEFTGCCMDNEEWIWEPRDEVKGDIARIVFYMGTRYEGENGEPDLEIVDYIPEKLTNETVYARLSILIEWHNNDPVDDYERNRNEVIYMYQGNRNPFIDHPEFVELIWFIE